MNQFDKFGIRQSIKQYTVHWSPPCTFGLYVVRLEIGQAVNVFDKIFFQDYDKHSLLESIIIKFSDGEYLFGMARLLLFFHEHYKQLFVERKLYLKHFQSIEIEMHNAWMSADAPRTYQHETSYPKFFNQERNKEYSIDDNRLEISSNELKQEIESFGIVYKNLLYWLQRRQDKSCKITFRFE